MEDTCERARRYAENVLRALESLANLPREFSRLLDASQRYAKDAVYFAGTGDCDTALAAASYAEGLIDSLKYLGYVEPKWPTSSVKKADRKVFIAGTFDLIHPGHIELMEFASKYGKVYAVVARDVNVEKRKGKKPLLSEESRLRIVSSIRYVYRARLGDPRDIMKPVVDIKPDVVVLGPDQPFDPADLQSRLRSIVGKEVLVVRFSEKKEFEPGMRGSSDIIRKVCCGSYCLSIGCSECCPEEGAQHSS